MSRSPPEYDASHLSMNGMVTDAPQIVYDVLRQTYTDESTPAHPTSRDLTEEIDELEKNQIGRGLRTLADDADCPIDIEIWGGEHSSPIRWTVDFVPEESGEESDDGRLIPDGGQVLDVVDEDLSRFELEIAYSAAHIGPAIGVDFKHYLESVFGMDLHHSRVYENLNALTDDEILNKEARDSRSYEWSLSEQGRELVRRDAQRRYLIADALGGDQA